MSELPAILAAARRDPAAYAVVVARFQSMALTCARARVHDHHLAEDIAQDAFLEAYRALPKLEHPGAFPALLGRLVLKHANRRTRRARLDTRPLEASALPPVADTPATRAEARDVRRTLAIALADLPPPQRLAVSLYYLRQHSIAEIAAFLGVPESRIKNRLHAARQKLQQRMLAMLEDSLPPEAPDPAFTARVQQAIATFTAKGPEHDHMRSDWHAHLTAEMKSLAADPAGHQLAVELAHSPHADVRAKAAWVLFIRGNPDALETLRALMHDPAADVRYTALRAYHALICPPADRTIWGDPNIKASALVPGLDALFPLTADPNTRVRLNAVQLLGKYARLGDPTLDTHLEKSLADPHHKIHHAAALSLQAPCPTCKTVPTPKHLRPRPT